MTDHTPGPWRVIDRTDILALEGTPESIVVASTQFFSGPPILARQIADARLIAAAPELLAAAKEAYENAAFHQSDCKGVASYVEGEIFDDTVGCDCYLSRIKAAIDKAEGR